ncbi:MFS transporter [Fimbriiglobus ruber]|uniref:Putative glucarate transporter n=1 Tax=Fimbriiglobus ruber TaxID=1908690 RepID=A0A225E184_9BACT|nr:MFS transporter [Fimbriiglobus ruber]OWK47480.1 putative glucarate transporter [Fimbriiglobus ruber]
MTPPNGHPATTPSAAPTRVRYSILALLCLLAMITYLDRAMYGSAKKDLMKSVGETETQFYLVLMAFQVAYAIFEIPTGWMGDTFGPRKTLLRIVLWWSVFVALTAFAGMTIPGTEIVPIGFFVLIGMQFLFGMGEAGAFPNISKSVYNWFPNNQRGFAQGAVWLSARFMGGMTPTIWVLLVTIGGFEWREALWLFAGAAVTWCVVFWFWFRNRPEEHPAVGREEADLINAGKAPPIGHGGVPWGTIFRSRNLWALCGMYMVTNFSWYFLMYNLPGTLTAQYPDRSATNDGKLLLALLSGAPLLVGMFGCLLGGALTDWYIRKTGDRKWGRRLFGMLGYGLAALFYLGAAGAKLYAPDNLWLFAGCLILMGFSNDLIMAPSWATAQDVGRKYAAIVSGTMNMVGNLGATLGLLTTGRILRAHTIGQEIQPTGFVICFVIYALVYGIGVLIWLLIDPTKPVVPDELLAESDHGTTGAND